MPHRAARPCRYPGCPELVRGEDRYCEEHRQQDQADYDAQRGSAAARGYGARWRRLRLMYLAAHPLCADPDGIHAEDSVLVSSNEVHHIVSKRKGGTDAMSNLQALCKPCHSRATSREGKKWG